MIGESGPPARAVVGSVLASLVGVVAGVGISLADGWLGWLLPGSIALAQTMAGAMLTGIVTLAVFAIWMRSVVAGLAAGQVSSRIVATYLDDAFQWRLLVGMCGAIAFQATVLLGLREELGDGIPALSVTSALTVVIAGLIAVLTALHQGVRQLAPPSILYRVADHARGLIAHDPSPDDEPLSSLPTIAPRSAGTVFSARMGWVGAVDHAAVLEALPPATGVRLLVDTGSFVDRGEPIAVADRPLDASVVASIEDAVDVAAWRSLDVDVGFALEQLRDLALQGLAADAHDSATATDALRYLGVVLRDLITRHEPTGVLIGTHERVLVSLGRQHVSDHLRDVLEPLVHAAADRPTTSRQLLGVLHALHAAADAPTCPARVRARLEQLAEHLERAADGSLVGESATTGAATDDRASARAAGPR